ncbi:unnamed protein product [Scytosiphon promiscuus]
MPCAALLGRGSRLGTRLVQVFQARRRGKRGQRVYRLYRRMARRRPPEERAGVRQQTVLPPQEGALRARGVVGGGSREGEFVNLEGMTSRERLLSVLRAAGMRGPRGGVKRWPGACALERFTC